MHCLMVHHSLSSSISWLSLPCAHSTSKTVLWLSRVLAEAKIWKSVQHYHNTYHNVITVTKSRDDAKKALAKHEERMELLQPMKEKLVALQAQNIDLFSGSPAEPVHMDAAGPWPILADIAAEDGEVRTSAPAIKCWEFVVASVCHKIADLPALPD